MGPSLRLAPLPQPSSQPRASASARAQPSSPHPEAQAQATCTSFLGACFEEAREGAPKEDEEEGEDLCDCEFSLAYGGKILLNQARLHLKRGQRYGLCGANGCGKSTLMRAIANGQLDGFPPKDQLRTVYVEHDIDGNEAETSVVDFVYNDAALQVGARAGGRLACSAGVRAAVERS